MCATRSSLRSRFLTHGDRNTRSRLRTLLERVRRTNRHRRAYRQLLARTGALSCTKEPPRARPEQSSVQSSRERSRSVSMLHRNESPNVYRAADRATPAANALQSRTWSPFNAMAWFGDPPCSVRQALLVLYWAGEDANCGGEDSQTDDRDRIAAEVARVRRDEGRRSRDARQDRLSRLLHHRRWRNRTRHLSDGCCGAASTTLQRHKTAIRRGFDRARRRRSVRTERRALPKVGDGSRRGTRSRSEQRRAVQFTTQRHAGLHKAAGDGERAGEEQEGDARHDCSGARGDVPPVRRAAGGGEPAARARSHLWRSRRTIFYFWVSGTQDHPRQR